MKKNLVLVLVIGILLTAAAFAEEKSDANFDVAARYYPSTFTSTNSPNYNVNSIWLMGDAFFGKQKWKGTVEWFGGNDTKTVTFGGVGTSIKETHSTFILRAGYDVWEKFYATLDYKSFNLKMNPGAYNQTFSGLGIGVQKHFELDKNWPCYAAIHYYPSITSAGSKNFHDFEYDVNVGYKLPKFVDVAVGYRGDSFKGYDSYKGTTATLSGPYIGVSKSF
jgi:hypothetical protein